MLTSCRCHHQIPLSGGEARRCKNRTRGDHLCWIHGMSDLHVRVKPSQIQAAGKGLWAEDRSQPANAILFRPREEICTYKGKVMDQAKFDRKYPENRPGAKKPAYVYKIQNDRYVDAKKSTSCFGRFINSAFGTRERQNCKIMGRDPRRRFPRKVKVRAVLPIRNHTELFTLYCGRTKNDPEERDWFNRNVQAVKRRSRGGGVRRLARR